MSVQRFRPRVAVEAMQFTTNNESGTPTMDAIVNWVNQGRDEMGAWHNGTDIFIRTPTGERRVFVGYWIVRGITGEFFPCGPDMFAKSYEELPEERPTTVQDMYRRVQILEAALWEAKDALTAMERTNGGMA
ncbi:hypothetical protein [Nocardia wallacei]|uniref:hypothetical protein n=1 Tax=Nocardia wallacei TaxID=480035 RepID=UPI002453B122|nr:hypothetical protein [Nocardia wallacei]